MQTIEPQLLGAGTYFHGAALSLSIFLLTRWIREFDAVLGRAHVFPRNNVVQQWSNDQEFRSLVYTRYFRPCTRHLPDMTALGFSSLIRS